MVIDKLNYGGKSNLRQSCICGAGFYPHATPLPDRPKHPFPVPNDGLAPLEVPAVHDYKSQR